MSDDQSKELERRVCQAQCFSDEEKRELLDLIRLMRGWKFVIKVAKGGTVVLAITAAAIASWSSVGEAIRKWLS